MRSLVYIIFFPWIFCISDFAKAQEGIITYEVKNNLHRTVRKEQEDMKNYLPEIYVTKHKLYFNSEASLYKMNMDEKEELSLNGGKKIGVPKYDIYIHPASLRRILVSYYNGNKYIIPYTIKTVPWNIEKDIKDILGYTCYKATYKNNQNKSSMIAWFTYQLRPTLGPYTYYTLPGAILEIDVNNGADFYRATEIEIRKLNKREIQEPIKGKKLTQEEYLDLIKR